MKTVVTRKGSGPALIRANNPAPFPGEGRGPASHRPQLGPGLRRGRALGWKLLLLSLGVIFALVVAHPALAQAVPAATPTPGVGDAADKALKELGGGANGTGAPMALSLQILIIMGLLTILPGILLMMGLLANSFVELTMRVSKSVRAEPVEALSSFLYAVREERSFDKLRTNGAGV